MEAQQQFDKIESYLAGALTGAELTTFEEQIQTNNELAAMVEEHRIAHDAVEMLIEQDLRKELEGLRTATTSTATPKVVQLPKRAATTTTRRRSLFPRLAAAASVILLIGFFTLQYNGSSNPIDPYLLDYPMPEVNRSGEATDLHPLAKGIDAYKTGNYEEEIIYYQGIAADDKRYNEAQFYLGHSFLRNKEYAAATTVFNKLVQSGDIRFLEKAEWYQLLSLVANQQQDKQFTTLLNKMLTDKNHSYHQQAQDLNTDL